MARIARIGNPGHPRHNTQRGKRRRQTYFNDDDDQAKTMKVFRKHVRAGRPIGDDDFIENVEKITGPRVKARKAGPEPKIVN